MSSMKIVSHDFWSTQMVQMLPKMIEPPSHDACIIVGTTQIPVDKTVLRLNSSLITDGIVDQNTSSGVTQIEVEPEFDDTPQLVGDIVNSFYSGTINIEEKDLKLIYKFVNRYKIGWLMKVVRPMMTDYIIKTADGSYERFKDIFTFAHFIYDTDLLEACIMVLDESYFLKMMIEDKDMLSKISYRCMELITKSEMTGISENGLFTLLASWAECREQKLCGLKDLFGNIKYELLDINFIVENVMEVMSKDKDLSTYFMGSLQQRFTSGMKQQLPETEENRPRNKEIKTEAVNRYVSRVIDLADNENNGEIDLSYLNVVLSSPGVQNVSEDLMNKLIPTILSEDFIANLNILSIANLLSSYKSVDGAKLFVAKIAKIRQIPSDFYKIEWTKIKSEAILCLLQLYNNNVGDFRKYMADTFTISSTDQQGWQARPADYNTCYIGIIEIAINWCLSNNGSVPAGILVQITNEICFKNGHFSDYSNVLLSTIQHLLPNSTELKCSHSGSCHGGDRYQFSWVNYCDLDENSYGQLYKLKPFSHDDFTLSEEDGLLELTRKFGEINYHLLLYNKNKPFFPNYPIFCTTLDDEAIRNLVGSLSPGDELAAICVW